MITVFTPTYNRAYIIENLYNSLLSQHCKDFEWLIVDDGSTDNTKELFDRFILDNKISVRYYHKENQGKHIAINYGVEKAKGEWFFIVDSDDYLTNDAIAIIQNYTSQIENNENYVGVSGNRCYSNNKRIGGDVYYEVLDCSPIDIREKYKVKGDLAEIWRTCILRQYPFPETKGEKFCTEALVWNRIAEKYILRYFNKNIYVCEYLQDGLSNSIIRQRMFSPINTTTFYAEQSKRKVSFILKVKANINFWRFMQKKSYFIAKQYKMYSLLSFLMFPLGRLYHFIDKTRI